MRKTLVGFAIACCFSSMMFESPARAASDGLLGVWYVLVHYHDEVDDETEGARRWEDKVWVFERRGSRLVWTEYAELAFENDAGRYQALSSGRTIRSSGSWKPNAAQRKEIDAGLAANPQWVRTKTLRGDAESGYRSSGKHNPESASVIGFSETWEIVDPAANPVFRRRDRMSSVRSKALEGETSYTTRKREDDRIEGEFARDDIQQGTFVMRRAGAVRLVAEEEVDEKWK